MYEMDRPRSISYMRLDQLHPAPRNPRVHDLPKLQAAITRHGFTVPILVCERRQEIAAGHGRWKALLAMLAAGEPTPAGILIDEDASWLVPVLRGWESRDDDEFEQYLVNDTQLARAGGWDNVLLASILDDLTTNSPDLFEELAMDHDDLDAMLRFVDPELLGEQDPDKPGRPDPVGTHPGDDERPERDPGELSPDGPGDASADRKVTCPHCHGRFVPGDQQFKTGSRARSGD
jgi:hypothetical protein